MHRHTFYFDKTFSCSVFLILIKKTAIEIRVNVSFNAPATEPFNTLYINQHTHTGIVISFSIFVFCCQLPKVAKIEAINGNMLFMFSQVSTTLPAHKNKKIIGIIFPLAHFLSRKPYTILLTAFTVFMATGVYNPKHAKCKLHTQAHTVIITRMVLCFLN